MARAVGDVVVDDDLVVVVVVKAVTAPTFAPLFIEKA
jgi:hypothetical protein